MRQDAVSLQRFYASPLGAVAARVLAGKIVDLWEDGHGLSMLGLGYAIPVLEPFVQTSRACVAAVPVDHGPVYWDAAGRGNAAVQVNDLRLPFGDGTFDRVIVLHGLEETLNPQQYIREIWRVTAPEGRIVLAVSNRVGVWARGPRTPFGHGRPWSKGQLTGLLSSGLFQVTASTHALFTPPLSWRLITAATEGWEATGRALLPGLGGVVLIEAVKRLYAKPGGGAVAPALDVVRVPRPNQSRREGH